ncbi:MAG: FecCD family ABC transporter permease [Alkalispirochaeta sp.]
MRRDRRNLALLALLLVAVSGTALLFGRYPRPGFLTPGTLRTDPLAVNLLLFLRLPRVITAILLGAGLGAAGAVMQMLFANPLVEPGLIGVSQGAGFGAILAITVGARAPWQIQGIATVSALLGMATAYRIARNLRFGGWILRLILSGIAVSALFSAGIGLLKFVADPLNELPEITFWLLGGIWNVDWSGVVRIAPGVVLGLGVLLAGRWRLNVLTLHDRVSFSLGANPSRERLVFLAAATLPVAILVASAGIISWVGLLVPHAARRLFRADAAVAVPASMLLGAIFVVLADTVARTIAAGEIPLGIVTALLGALAFVYLLLTHNIRMTR